MENKKIESQRDYEEIAVRIEVLQHADAGSEEEKELWELTRQLVEFECKRIQKAQR